MSKRRKRKKDKSSLTPEERLKIALDIVDDDMPDGAYWALVHEIAGLEYGDAFDMLADNPDYYGVTITDMKP